MDHVLIHSVAVRGRLGPLTVWVSKQEASPNPQDARRGFRMNPRHWDKIYQRTHGPSFREYVQLDLRENPIKLSPGQTRAIYIHSTSPGDEAIVYDNRHSKRTYDDSLISILTGRAHVSTTPFGNNPIWGWGNSWRDNRFFVGRLEYGAVYRLWSPLEFLKFGHGFQQAARTLFLCQRRWESPISKLPDECIFYILNMCKWDWFADTGAGMKAMRKQQRKRAAAAALLRAQQQEQSNMLEASPVAVASVARREAVDSSDEEEAAVSCCNRQSPGESQQQANASDEEEAEEEEYHAAREEEEFDDDEDEYVEEMDEFDEEEEEDDDDDDEDWDSDDGYNANNELFVIEDDDSDEEENERESPTNHGQRAWIHRQFARIHVLQALAALDDNGVEEMNH